MGQNDQENSGNSKMKQNIRFNTLKTDTSWIRPLLLAGWVLVIWGHSMVPADLSSEESGRVLLMVTDLAGRLGIGSEWLSEHIIRKMAHFSEYTIYGVLLLWNFNSGQGKHRRRQLERAGGLWYPLILAVVAVPFMDETIQLFVPGRSGQITDVWLDMAGCCFGFLCLKGFSGLLKNLATAGRRRKRL